MIARGALLALALGALVAGKAAAADPTQDQIERLERADALLEERAGWDEAITLYRGLLGESPEWTAPRLSLARVLAWRGDYAESLETLRGRREESLRAAGPASNAPKCSPGRVATTRRACSSKQALRASRTIPRANAASRGRIYGAVSAPMANEWYISALAFEDDAEARQEWGFAARRVEEAGRSERVRLPRLREVHVSPPGLEASLDWDFDTRIYATTGVVFSQQDAARTTSSPVRRTTTPRSRAGSGSSTASRRLEGVARTRRPRLETRRRPGPLARAVVEYAPTENAVAAIEVAHGDQLEHSYSFESVQQGIGRTGGTISYWRQLNSAGRATQHSVAHTSATQRRTPLGGSVAWRPFPAIDVQIALALDAMHYQDASPYYYSPDIDLGGMVSVMGRVPIDGRALAGLRWRGRRRILARSRAFVLRSRVSREARTRLGARRLQRHARCARSQSVRDSAYTTHEAAMRVSWSF